MALMGISITCSVMPVFAESGTGWVSYPGGEGAGKGKKVVLLAGDEEYRSEEALPMLAKVLSERHGFQCTVLFSTGADGTIDPNNGESINKPEALDSADVIVTSLRFRKWPDAAMEHFDKAVKRGVSIVAMRTSTHSFQLPGSSAFKQYNSYGKNILGETWVTHWGQHKSQATIGVIEKASESDPLLSGVKDIFVTTDVYEAYPPADATILIRGQVLSGMKPTDPPAAYEKTRASDKGKQDVNSPMMPIAWKREVKGADGKTNKVLCTTMGAGTDLKSEDLRRLVVNGVFWGAGLTVPAKVDVAFVGEYEPNAYDFNGFKKGLKAGDFELKK